MSWPKGRPRPRKVSGGMPPEQEVSEATELPDGLERDPNQPPADWRKGALLNVRNHGAEYIITLWPEEYSPEREDRAIKFTNLGVCQDFVSKWYAAEHHDPRAR